MSERERWVVYPLLFLALGAALRDKLVDRTVTKRIVCQELRIEDEPIGDQPAQVLAIIGRAPKPTGPATGFFYLNGSMDIIDGDPAVVPQPRTLVQIGRTEPSPGVNSVGFAAVNGAVFARQVAPLPLLSGLDMPDFMRLVPASPDNPLPTDLDIKIPTDKRRSKAPEGTPDNGDDSGRAKSNAARDAAPAK